MVLIFRECPHCGNHYHIHVPEDEYNEYCRTKDTACFTKLSAREGYLLECRCCPECGPEMH